MNEVVYEKYKKDMKRCYLCRQEIQGEVHLVSSLVPLTKYPEHAMVVEGVQPTYIQVYGVCSTCLDAKVLI